MRIIAGSSRGRRLKTPKGDRIRPTSDRVRESLFSILGDLGDLHVIDGFAGTGALGLEALSRGARHATFIERDKKAQRLIAENIAICKVEARSTLVRGEFEEKILTRRTADLIFLDPPYDTASSRLLDAIATSGCLSEGGLVVLEQASREELLEARGWELEDERVYGETRLTFYRPTES